jgi:hypothetical protein
MFLVTGVIGGALVGLIYAIGRSNPVAVFITVEGLITFFSLLSWASNGILFDGDKIVRRAFFLVDTVHPIRDIRKVRFDRNEDSFGGIMPTVTIDFNDGKRFLLISFKRADINTILERIKTSAPDIDDKAVMNDVDENEKQLNEWRSAFRPGDRFLFSFGAIVVLLAMVWWLLQKLGLG